MTKLSRRKFNHLLATAAATSAVAPLGLLNSRMALAQTPQCNLAGFAAAGFGPIQATLPNNSGALTEIAGVGDINGIPLLELPANFQYTAISIRGAMMSDGALVPGDHDGMAAFPGRAGNTVLVRNHELSIDENEAGNITGCLTPNGNQYDPFQGDGAGLGGGGTSTLVVNRKGERVEDYLSLGGTIRNCAGGPTYWGSWISCEENVSTPTTDPRVTVRHGYNFEVPSQLREAVDPIPLVAMGRMNHEAVSVDPVTGYIYQTEDRGDSAYYCFKPWHRPNGFGDLQKGGELFAMVIDKNQRSHCTGDYLPTSVLNGTEVVDTRGLGRGGPASLLPFLGQPLKVTFVKLDDVDPAEDTLRLEAQSRGAAVWWRGEGAWYHQGRHYWVCSGAGDAGEGQVWVYDPRRETVTLLVESTDENLLDGPDNMTVARDGTLYLCEDGSDGEPGQGNFSQKIIGVDSRGGLFDFARNILDTSEFAGACFSPDGHYLYVNSQGVGITYVIWRTDHRPIYLNTF